MPVRRHWNDNSIVEQIFSYGMGIGFNEKGLENRHRRVSGALSRIAGITVGPAGSVFEKIAEEDRVRIPRGLFQKDQ